MITKYEPVIEVDPTTVVFANYQKNKTYQKKILVKNITKCAQSYIIKKKPKLSIFTIAKGAEITKVAPGMTGYILIQFRSNVLLDLQDSITIRTGGCEDIEIRLACFRNAPSLRAFVLKSVGQCYNMPDPANFDNEFDIHRSHALNSVIDCGSCFLGNNIEVSLVMRNEGSMGKFFIMTEDEWFKSEISLVNECLELSSTCFQIYPAYFVAKSGEFVEVRINFCPLYPGLIIQYLYILCDNNTFEKIDLIGDCLTFRRDLIHIQVKAD